MNMTCEQFLLEAAYLGEAGDGRSLGAEALAHARQCLSCSARLPEFLNNPRTPAPDAFTPVMSQRLHQAIDQVMHQKPARMEQLKLSRRMWLQMAAACLVLVGFTMFAYEGHPTPVPQVSALLR